MEGRHLEEACPNHAYPIQHKLKDCGMMRSFLTLGSLTWGAELDEDPHGSDMMTFPEENTIMMVYGGRSPSGRCRMSNLSPRAQLVAIGDMGAQGCNDTSFSTSL
jgi:hypothetical protein